MGVGGIFDRTSVGADTSPVAIDVERGKIREFAAVLGETDPIHFDVTAARARGFADLVAPPSFFVVIDALGDELLTRRGERTAGQLIACDFRYLLHGDERYRYSGPICAGDRLTLTTRVDGFEERKGGLLEFARLTSTAVHAERRTVVIRRRTLIHRLPDHG